MTTNNGKQLISRKRGAAIITAVLFFVVITLAMAIGLSSPVVREYKTSRDFEKSKGAYYLSESGSEDALYRIKKGITIGIQENLYLDGNTATTTITEVGALEKLIRSLADINTNTRRVKSTLTKTNTASFNSGVEAGDGGVIMKNAAVINGNLFSNGPIIGNGNTITGAVVSASSTIGSITNIKSGGSMYAPNIVNSTITVAGLMYCDTISGSTPNVCTAASTSTPGTLQFTQAEITQWEADAAAGGTITCIGNTYPINGAMNLGPVKITGAGGTFCNVDFNANADITLGGAVWVNGNIDIKSNAILTVSAAYPGQSMMLIADNITDRLNSSTIEVANRAVFNGAGAGSYIMLLGQNDGASRNPPQNTEAIEVEDRVIGSLLVYAGLGDILIKGQAVLKQVSGYKITLQDTANVTYETGLTNVVFTSGPGGSWVISDWKEEQ